MTILWSIVFLFCNIFPQILAQHSPCPDVVKYIFDGREFHGIVIVPNAGQGRTNLKIKLSIEGIVTKENSGQIILMNSESVADTIKNNQNLQYRIEFPNSPNIPEILSVMLNKIEYCAAAEVEGSVAHSIITIEHSFQLVYPPVGEQTLSHHQAPTTPFPPQPLTTTTLPPIVVHAPGISKAPQGSNDPSWLFTYKFGNMCGMKDEPSNTLMAVHTIINGKPVDPGEYPWLVALFKEPRTFICGGSLVSEKHVITAAHCTAKFPFVYVELGKHDVNNRGERGIAIRVTERIINHEEYKEGSGHADISILVLTEGVTFSDKIKPVCLWSFKDDTVGVTGSIAGWGTDLSGDSSATPMQVDVDIIDHNVCKNSHKQYLTITSPSTFCAGGKNKGPCLGDSGSGMYVQRGGRWFLKGVISISLGNKITCDVNKYSVYVDIGKYLDWIKLYIL